MLFKILTRPSFDFPFPFCIPNYEDFIKKTIKTGTQTNMAFTK